MSLKQVATLLITAAGVVVAVVGLFNSALDELVPPTTGLSPNLYAGLASFAALIVLLLIILAAPARLNISQRRWTAGIILAISIAAFGTLFLHVSNLNAYVFVYPDVAQTDEKSNRYIRGEYNELGRKITEDMSVSAAVDSVGGLKRAMDNNLLWTEQSQKAVELRVVVVYVISHMLLTTALFGLAVAVLRSGKMRTVTSAGESTTA